MSTVNQKLRKGDSAVGTMVRMIRNPGIAWLVRQAGLDLFMLDMEHGTYNTETVADIATTARAAGVGCFVRVPELAKGYVSRVLDCGCTGVMVPMIESVEQAELLVRWSKFEPVGGRGFGSVGGHTNYQGIGGADTVDFTLRANEEVLTIAQIETRAGMEQVEKIAALEGIDALLIGPSDLSMSLGHTGDMKHAEVIEAIDRIATAAQKNDKVFSIHGPDWLIEQFRPKGLNLIMSALDMNMLLGGMKSISDKWGSSK